MIEDITKFFKLYSIQKVLQISLISIGIFLIIDMLNIPTIVIEKYSIYGIGLFFTVSLFILINKKIINLFKINVINYIDLILVSSFISTLTYIFFSWRFMYTIFKINMLLFEILIIIICIIVRVIYCYITTSNKKSEENINVYDLKQLYNNEIENKNKELIFLEEKDVAYDMLNRTKIINDLYNSITYCRNKNKFIISLTGSWGSGKTTILNIVKDNLHEEKFIIIDNFDVWKYNNEKSLFYAMFDEIMKRTNMNFSLLEVKKFVNTCVNMVSANTDIDINLLNSESEIIDKIKNIINDYLIVNNKRVLFLIDNLERTNEKNILVIIKTISTILDLDRFIYILSYDENEMKEIFKEKLKINYDYLEKVIQLPLKVPDINEDDIKRICTKCMENLLLMYGVTKEEIEKYRQAMLLFNTNIKDLRSFKRKINSIFNSNFYNKNYLNVIDSFLLELIHEENIDLYNSIKENYKYFVSEDQICVYGHYYEKAKVYNENASKYFDKLFFENSNNMKYVEILKMLFPNVNKYFSMYDIPGKHVEFWNESTYIFPRDEEIHIQSVLERRIYNAKFFGLYFTKQENGFIYIDNRIQEFVDFINKEEYDLDNIKIVQSEVIKLLTIFKDDRQRYILETLEFYISKIMRNKLLLLLSLWNLEKEVDNTMMFLGINTRERLIIICAEIIKKLSEEEISNVKKIIEIDYKSMEFIKRILYWLEPKNTGDSNNYDKSIYEEILKSYEKLLENVMRRGINIYDKNNYSRHNINCLMEEDRYKQQIKNINKDTIFMFLADMISVSYGTRGYGYSINKGILEKFITYEVIDNIIERIEKDKITQIENFIIEIYDKSKQINDNMMEEAIYLEKYIDLGKVNRV